ncbi:hypothetical protein BC829DRAFT_111715 [Chytridium lagenaria]|nr:hypothetical protein BC829DRAFT_111715 [Chytridium lagenaria]
MDQMIFDEAQQHVYSILKGHSFVRFEKSVKISELMKKRTLSVEEYKRANLSTNYYDAFALTEDHMNSFIQHFERITNSSEPESTPTRDSALNSVIQALFPSSKYLPVEGYFSDPSRLTAVKKKRKIRKEKKINKFFGERPSFEQLQRQLVAANLPQAGIEHSLAWTPGSARPIYDAGEDQGDSFVKRKRAEKLSEFFGTNLGRVELRMQHLADASHGSMPQENPESGSESDDEPLETVNELDQDTKRQLRKRNKKLVAIWDIKRLRGNRLCQRKVWRI